MTETLNDGELRAEIIDWLNAAPPDVELWLRAVTTLNFLREDRNRLFQSCLAYDGAMSVECAELLLSQYLVVNAIHGWARHQASD